MKKCAPQDHGAMMKVRHSNMQYGSSARQRAGARGVCAPREISWPGVCKNLVKKKWPCVHIPWQIHHQATVRVRSQKCLSRTFLAAPGGTGPQSAAAERVRRAGVSSDGSRLNPLRRSRCRVWKPRSAHSQSEEGPHQKLSPVVEQR